MGLVGSQPDVNMTESPARVGTSAPTSKPLFGDNFRWDFKENDQPAERLAAALVDRKRMAMALPKSARPTAKSNGASATAAPADRAVGRGDVPEMPNILSKPDWLQAQPFGRRFNKRLNNATIAKLDQLYDKYVERQFSTWKMQMDRANLQSRIEGRAPKPATPEQQLESDAITQARGENPSDPMAARRAMASRTGQPEVDPMASLRADAVGTARATSADPLEALSRVTGRFEEPTTPTAKQSLETDAIAQLRTGSPGDPMSALDEFSRAGKNPPAPAKPQAVLDMEIAEAQARLQALQEIRASGGSKQEQLQSFTQAQSTRAPRPREGLLPRQNLGELLYTDPSLREMFPGILDRMETEPAKAVLELKRMVAIGAAGEEEEAGLQRVIDANWTSLPVDERLRMFVAEFGDLPTEAGPEREAYIEARSILFSDEDRAALGR